MVADEKHKNVDLIHGSLFSTFWLVATQRVSNKIQCCTKLLTLFLDATVQLLYMPKFQTKFYGVS